MVSSFFIGIKEFLVVKARLASKCLSQRHAFSSAKIQNKNAVCKFFPQIGTTKLFFNTFLSVSGINGKKHAKGGFWVECWVRC